MTQVPAPMKVTVLPEIVQTELARGVDGEGDGIARGTAVALTV